VSGDDWTIPNSYWTAEPLPEPPRYMWIESQQALVPHVPKALPVKPVCERPAIELLATGHLKACPYHKEKR
jgi:hypothetical protein